jgi:hypothetical protein
VVALLGVGGSSAGREPQLPPALADQADQTTKILLN